MWLDAMTEYLPYHEDRFFLMFQAAAQGSYRPQFTPPDSDEEPDPVTVRAAANRALDEFGARADMAMRRRRQKGR